MAKSALEAINGCNLFGDKGASWSVVYVDIDAHNRNRSIFETLLPRESSSKVRKYTTWLIETFLIYFVDQEVDASLLPTISFPAFATHDEQLLSETKQNIQKLRGTYGFKRFSRDGFNCSLEDPTQRYYKEGKTKVPKITSNKFERY
jgi:phosphorylase kinase alpha/beta subunit